MALSDEEYACSAGEMGLIPGSGKILWRRKWQRTPAFLPEKFHWQTSLASYSPWGYKESDTTEHTFLFLFSVSLWNNRKYFNKQKAAYETSP